MKALSARELKELAAIVETLDDIAKRYGHSNICGTLYAVGSSFSVDYDEDSAGHRVEPA